MATPTTSRGGGDAVVELSEEQLAALEERARREGITVSALLDRILNAALDEELSTS